MRAQEAALGALLLVFSLSAAPSAQSAEDTTPPLITLIGANPYGVTLGTAYIEPGYTCTDAVDGVLTDSVLVSGVVDNNVAGDYVLTYSVSDAAGNTAQVTRTVRVLAEGANELGITLTRTVSGEYVPGEALDITVTIDAADDGVISALGLSENIPAGWYFDSATAVTGALPSILPSLGATGTLSFAWLYETPSMPCSFIYTLVPATGDSGTKTISGHVVYRTVGPEQDSGIVTTQIAAGKAVQVLSCAGAPAGPKSPFGTDVLLMVFVALGLFAASLMKRYARCPVPVTEDTRHTMISIREDNTL